MDASPSKNPTSGCIFIFYTIAGGRAKSALTRGAFSLILISSAPFPEIALRVFPGEIHVYANRFIFMDM
jgi:hypothetical protein